MARKTIGIAELTTKANEMMADSHNNARDMRYGMIALLEWALHETGNYSGFSYLSGGVKIESGETLPDPSRRVYTVASDD